MLSKIIRREQPQDAELMTWPTAGQPEQSRVQPAPYGGEGSQNQLGDMQQRLAEMKTLMERGVSEARQAGYREGEAAARAQAGAELQAVLKRLAAGIDEIAAERARVRQESEIDLVKLAVAIARRILHRQLSVDPDAIGGIVGAALEKL
jgi:flagellar assembly protein FliH